MRPHYPDTYEGCTNGCDGTLCEILQINTSRPSSSSSTTISNTQLPNRNLVTTNQNRGKTKTRLNILFS